MANWSHVPASAADSRCPDIPVAVVLEVGAVVVGDSSGCHLSNCRFADGWFVEIAVSVRKAEGWTVCVAKEADNADIEEISFGWTSICFFAGGTG